jgi:hypothetical protein
VKAAPFHVLLLLASNRLFVGIVTELGQQVARIGRQARAVREVVAQGRVLRCIYGTASAVSGENVRTGAFQETTPRSTRARQHCAHAREAAGNQRPWPADKVERWAIDRLIPYAKNARTHTDAQVAAIASAGGIRHGFPGAPRYSGTSKVAVPHLRPQAHHPSRRRRAHRRDRSDLGSSRRITRRARNSSKPVRLRSNPASPSSPISRTAPISYAGDPSSMEELADRVGEPKAAKSDLDAYLDFRAAWDVR